MESFKRNLKAQRRSHGSVFSSVSSVLFRHPQQPWFPLKNFNIAPARPELDYYDTLSGNTYHSLAIDFGSRVLPKLPLSVKWCSELQNDNNYHFKFIDYGNLHCPRRPGLVF